ncbi:MAG: DUF2791 family P-loop domain-containing protein [Candidatus Odinarchaeota archaeon]|nr:DUF2791 family P-loop domain-containing protein [Candidatus Odinarchaeota archaeon]
MDENLKNELLELLKEEPPFRRYVSRGDTPDEIDVEGPHEEVDRVIRRIIKLVMGDKIPRFQPILGKAGMGKTHYFWVLKDLEKKDNFWKAVYIPSPPSPVRMLLHFYTCVLDECGDWIIDAAAESIVERNYERRGLFRKMSLAELIAKTVEAYPGVTADIVKALVIYKMDGERKDLAKRWLLAENLNEEELQKLGVRSIIDDDGISLAALKVLTTESNVPLLFFIDEIEGMYNIYGEEGERKFLEAIKKVYNEVKNIIIVVSCLEDIWDRVYNSADDTVKSRIEPTVKLRSFTKEDLREFIVKTMEKYWDRQNMEPPEDRIFPFTEEDINEIFEKSKGNPRQAIRESILKLDEILFGKKVEEKEEVKKSEEYVIKLTPSVIADVIIKAIRNANQEQNLEVTVQTGQGQVEEKIGKKVAAIIEIKNNEKTTKLALEIPNIKSWNRSGGVSVYYVAKRLKELLDKKLVDFAIIPMPKQTAGAKLKAITEEMKDHLITLKFDEQELISIVESSMNSTPCEKLEEIGKLVIDKIKA